MLSKKFNSYLNRETILYGIFGLFTTALNIILFAVLTRSRMEYKSANIVTLIVTKFIAYICNKLFVFDSHCNNIGDLCKEFVRFLVTRGATMVLDYFGLILLVEICGVKKFLGKCVTTIIVVIINYFVGKKSVFLDRRREIK